MTLDEFRKSVSQASPPAGLSAALEALWFEAKGDWDRAHRLAQEASSREGDWVHAYLHRKEGDAANAAYWYRRAERAVFKGALDVEWMEIAGTLLEESE
jgi:hypothetical protein